MRPDIDAFTEVVRRYRGNLSKVADAYKVSRVTVAQWAKDPEYKAVVKDARMRMYDSALLTAEMLATGIPDTDENGKFIGWIERPDSNMVRYIIGHLGADDGLSDTPASVTIENKDGESGEIRGISINVVYNDKKDLELQGKREESEE